MNLRKNESKSAASLVRVPAGTVLKMMENKNGSGLRIGTRVHRLGKLPRLSEITNWLSNIKDKSASVWMRACSF